MLTPDTSYDEPIAGRPRAMPRIKRRMLDDMDAPNPNDLTGAPVDRLGSQGPANGNTGIGGGLNKLDPPPVSAPPPTADFSADALMPILRKYDHNTAGLQKAFSENPQWGAAGAKVQGGDIFNPLTGRWLDVIRGANRGGEDWQYLDEQQGGADYDPNKGAMAGGIGSMRGMDSTQTSLIDQVRQMILQLMGNGQ